MGTVSTKHKYNVRLPGELQALFNSIKLASFVGVAAAGPCTATGVTVGQFVLGVAPITDAAEGVDDSAAFETQITVDDEIQQIDTANLAAVSYAAIIVDDPTP